MVGAGFSKENSKVEPAFGVESLGAGQRPHPSDAHCVVPLYAFSERIFAI
jgi:hypothetical protein